MSLEAGRVGVRNDQVDAYGRINANDTFIDDIIRDLPGWTDMPVWRGGTEAILPENDDEPETSPILADIQYPDALRNNQYFLYRESPTTVDGKAKIRRIQGNTLVWNQLVQNGNFAVTSGWTATNGTYSIANNICTLTPSGANARLNKSVQFVKDHTYAFFVEVKPSYQFNLQCWMLMADYSHSRNEVFPLVANVNNYAFFLMTANYDYNLMWFQTNNSADQLSPTEFRNAMVIDLTQLNSSLITDVSSFRSRFNLPYYTYTQGKLLPFKGESLKTVGFNQWDEEWEVGRYNNTTGAKEAGNNDRVRNKNKIRVLPNTQYYFGCQAGGNVYFYDESENYINYLGGASSFIFTTPVNCGYICFFTNVGYGSTYLNNICINISDASKNGKYEPYTSNTNNLPTLDFFPTGMKAVPDHIHNSVICDELLPDKAITRIGSIDLGSLDWQYSSGAGRFYVTNLDAGIKAPPNVNTAINGISSMYDVVSWTEVRTNNFDKSLGVSNLPSEMNIRDTEYTDVATFKQMLTDQNVKLYFELAIPIVEPTIIIE